ncbi:MAG: peptidylprolyl isomerase [Acetobacteraceae bacterium]|nr:peptidylprolyl isomerase [Acetobacteraceae bacterium]
MFRYSSLLGGAFALATGMSGVSPTVLAQGTPATPPATPALAAAPSAPANPVVARVEGLEIRMSDVSEAAQSLPEQLRGMPQATLFPMLVDQLVDARALAVHARKVGLDKQGDVRQLMEAAAERALQSAFVAREIGPQVNEVAVRARYDREIVGKPGAEEVHARHILVATEDEAKKIIQELKKGGGFAALAKQHSSDPGAQQGGDLGFFKKDDMVPEFAGAAFALKPGEFTQIPVKTQFGFHVIKLEERRASAALSFEDLREELRQKMIQDAYQKLSQTARAGVRVERFNMDGTVPRPTDNAEPPPARPR